MNHGMRLILEVWCPGACRRLIELDPIDEAVTECPSDRCKTDLRGLTLTVVTLRVRMPDAEVPT